MARIIFALDFDNLKIAERYVKKFKKHIDFFKIGFQLFTKYGPDSIKMVKNEGKEVFLDLKLFDIPEICATAVKNAAELGCYSITLHLLAGEKAVIYSKKAQIKGKPHIWGVTILSSLKGDSLKLARIGAKHNIEGFIVSGRDIEMVKGHFPDKEIVTPGIRPRGFSGGEHKKILTPEKAVKLGSNFLVIGRKIQNLQKS